MARIQKRFRGTYRRSKIQFTPNDPVVADCCYLANTELLCPSERFDEFFPERRVLVSVPQSGVPQTVTIVFGPGVEVRLSLSLDSEPLPIQGPCRGIRPDEITRIDRLEPRGKPASESPGQEPVRPLNAEEYQAASALAEAVLRQPDPAGLVTAERRPGGMALRLADCPAPGFGLAFTLPPAAEARDLASVFIFRVMKP